MVSIQPGLTLLRLLQVADAQFPVGSFAHSAGLETYAQEGLDRVGLEALLRHGVALGSGRLDAAALVRAYRASDAEQLARIAGELAAWKPVPPLRDASLRLGRRTLTLLRRLDPGLALPELALPFQPLVLGCWGRASGIELPALTLATLHAAAVSALAAATRCMPLSPEAAQEILAALHPSMLAVAAEAIADPETAMWSATPAADIAAHRQQHLYSRLFQS